MSYRSVFRPGLFRDWTIVVTGGGSGIGRCTAHELAALGAHVVLVGRNPEKLEQVQAEIIEDGGHADTQALDIRVEDDVIAAVDQIVSRHERIDGLVNNAGGQFPASLEDTTFRGWEAVVRTNLTGGFLVAREVFKQSMKANGGAVVNITADFWMSMPTMGHSGAARAGMHNFTMTAAVEWGPYGVRVNEVAPGWIASSGFDSYDDEEIRRQFSTLHKQVPLNRVGREAEVSAAVVFLLSPAAAFISGANLRVDGAAPNYPRNYTLPDGPGNAHFDGFHRETLPKVLGGDD